MAADDCHLAADDCYLAAAGFWAAGHFLLMTVKLLLSLANGVHDEPTRLERCTAAACFHMEGCMKAVLRMLKGSAEGFSAFFK